MAKRLEARWRQKAANGITGLLCHLTAIICQNSYNCALQVNYASRLLRINKLLHFEKCASQPTHT